MSLTDSEKIKNYSNKTDKNIKVAVDKKTTLSSVLGKNKKGIIFKPTKCIELEIKKILLDKSNVIGFKKK